MAEFPFRHAGWVADAACRHSNPELFFPARGEVIAPELRAMCASCPVREQCLAAAMERHEDGFWAGTTEAERQRRRRSESRRRHKLERERANAGGVE